MALLKADNIGVRLHERGQAPVALVDGVSFQLQQGQSMGLVGESGSGKSLLCRALLDVLPPAMTACGKAEFAGASLLDMPEQALEKVRGAGIAMIPQDAATAFAPSFTLGTQLIGTLRGHTRCTAKQAREAIINALSNLHMPDAAHVLTRYPHQLSGGMLQRCMLALTLLLRPRVIIADEPTTALDVLARKEAVDALMVARESTKAALILVSHDLALVGALADQILVLHQGRVVEYGVTKNMLDNPRHEHTRYLLGSCHSAKYRYGTAAHA